MYKIELKNNINKKNHLSLKNYTHELQSFRKRFKQKFFVRDCQNYTVNTFYNQNWTNRLVRKPMKLI